jgi:hypothetical protein
MAAPASPGPPWPVEMAQTRATVVPQATAGSAAARAPLARMATVVPAATAARLVVAGPEPRAYRPQVTAGPVAPVPPLAFAVWAVLPARGPGVQARPERQGRPQLRARAHLAATAGAVQTLQSMAAVVAQAVWAVLRRPGESPDLADRVATAAAGTWAPTPQRAGQRQRARPAVLAATAATAASAVRAPAVLAARAATAVLEATVALASRQRRTPPGLMPVLGEEGATAVRAVPLPPELEAPAMAGLAETQVSAVSVAHP